ncbi:hypothetical protein G7054_g575 [Neopestalotiopsis clavispora]|nr:hypothetical protein G7054_g575 [Neopestalotiopsis clavispora]
MTVELLQFDQLSCYSSSKEEAQFIYKEIFVDHCYNVTELPEAPFIVDAVPRRQDPAFEPAPQTYDVLSRNLALNHISGVEALQYGLASEPSTMKLTYYPNLPGNSTLVPEEKQKLYEEAVKKRGREVADARFGGAQQVDVKLERLSRFLDGVQAVDLLKVDVEGAELEVIKGIDDEHWALVRNVVVETWEPSGIRPEIERLLECKGFAVSKEQAEWAPDQFCMIIANRNGGELPKL